MSARHTPGPWFTWEDGVYSGTPTSKQKGMLTGYDAQICEMDDFGVAPSERKANARLIAAAPDLLGALVMMDGLGLLQDCMGDSDGASCSKQVAREALAKARGEA